MKEQGKIWMNGKLVPFKNAKIHVLTHALHYSTAVFEGIRCYNTPKGSVIFRLREHIDRFFRSAKMYSMKIPYARSEERRVGKRVDQVILVLSNIYILKV